MNKRLLDKAKEYILNPENAEKIRKAIEEGRKQWEAMPEWKRDKIREQKKCPGCHEIAGWIGDNYGRTCNNCGYNWGYGASARQNWCNHDLYESGCYKDEETIMPMLCCMYCHEIFKSKEDAAEQVYQRALRMKRIEDYLRHKQEEEEGREEV